MTTWSSASYLPIRRIDKERYFSSTFVPLPDVSGTYRLPNLKKFAFVGFSIQGHYLVEGPKGPRFLSLLSRDPSDLDSVLYDKPAYCPNAAVICTPYIEVRHIHPQSARVSVDMLGAHRWRHESPVGGGGRGTFENSRHAKTYHKTFE